MAYKPLLAIIICTGFAEFGEAVTLAEWLRGCATLLLGILAPGPLMKIFAPFGAAVGGGMAAGGMSPALAAAADYFGGKSSGSGGGGGEPASAVDALECATVPLDIPAVRGILPRGGTVLGSSRTNPLRQQGGIRRIKDNLAALGVDALITIGGEDTLGVATRLADEYGVPCVGVPKTIDNDLSATDYTFGFDTAVGIATEAIDRLHTTAESHMRVLVVEVMGRHAGWIALHSGLAGGANVILIPEQRFDVEQVCTWVTSRFRASYAPIVVVAEGAMPRDGDLVLKDESLGLLRARPAVRGRRCGWPSRSRNAPARRPAPPSSAMSSAAAPPAPSTAGSPPASDCTPSTACATGTSGRWSPCAARISSASPSPRPPSG
ncbi:Pyrophosphate--fructose 6-phosphate 1-phosphotransferase [Streptomyces badius]